MSAGRTRVAVIGGGIAGPVTALALHRIGVQATVYEAYDHGAEQAGAFLMAAPNGLAALQLLGAHTGVVAAGFPTPRFAISTGKGRVLGTAVSTTTVAGRPEPVTIRRNDLYRAITAEVRRAGIPVEYGKRLTGVDELDGGLRARFSDGSSATAELLVGADGLRSRTRTVIDPAAPAPRYLGLVGCGGYARTTLLDSPPGVFHFVFGKRAFFGYTAPRAEQLATGRTARRDAATGPDRGLRRGPGPRGGRHPRDRAPDRCAAHARPRPVADVAPGPAGAHRRRRPRHVAILRAGGVAGRRGRGGARAVPARPARPPAGLPALPAAALAAGEEDLRRRRADEQHQGGRPGGSPAARRAAAGDVRADRSGQGAGGGAGLHDRLGPAGAARLPVPAGRPG